MRIDNGTLAGWRRGYAADCKSVRKIPVSTICHSENSADRCFCKHPGQSGNKPKTSQTAGWWFLPMVAAGLAVWIGVFWLAGVL